MTYSLTWLPGVLRAAGLRVVEVPGWQTRGHGDVKDIRLVICHHTAEPIDKNLEPSVQLLTEGSSRLHGPLSQLGLGQDGTYYVVAAGKAYHAGIGRWDNITDGNPHSIGIEAENNGVGEPWPVIQMDAYERGCAALLRHLKLPVTSCIGHKEWAPKRKIDPTFDMNLFRTHVAAFIAGVRPPRIMVPRFLNIVRRWETYQKNAYPDKDGSWHVAYGHGNAAGVPPFVDPTTVVATEREAMTILMADLAYLLPILEKLIKVPVNDNQFCALLDVAYNRGPGTLRESAIIYHLNNPADIAEGLNYKRACRAFAHHEKKPDGTDFPTLDTAYDKSLDATRVYLGLELRRLDDGALFQAPITE